VERFAYVRAPIAAAHKEPFLRVASAEHGSDVVSESAPCGSQRTKDFVNNNQSLPGCAHALQRSPAGLRALAEDRRVAWSLVGVCGILS
jgi:hypothetical protein